MKNRRFAPNFDVMEVRMTPSDGVAPPSAAPADHGQPIDFTTPPTGVDFNPFACSGFTTDESNFNGIDFLQPPTGVDFNPWG